MLSNGSTSYEKAANFNVEMLPHGFDSKAVYEVGPVTCTCESIQQLTHSA